MRLPAAGVFMLSVYALLTACLWLSDQYSFMVMNIGGPPIPLSAYAVVSGAVFPQGQLFHHITILWKLPWLVQRLVWWVAAVGAAWYGLTGWLFQVGRFRLSASA